MSGMFTRLREEAERASASNKMALFHTKQRQGLDAVSKFSGQSARTKMTVGGLGLSMGSYLGMMGIGIANQAATIGSAGVLSSASTALAGLGTVTLGTAVLPVATVVALGGAVAGIAILGASRLMNVDRSKGFALQRTLEEGDLKKFQALSNDSLGLKDWFSGAKSLLVSAFQRDAQKKMEIPENIKEIGNPQSLDDKVFSIEYELVDLYGESPEKNQQRKQEIASQLGEKIWKEHNIVVTEDKIHSAFEGTRGNSDSYGKIIGIDKGQCLVIQSTGRGQATVHNLLDFGVMPKIGAEMMISYRGGQMRPPQEKGIGQTTGIGR